ncbi:MAG: hypothetical protein KUG69_08345, partial [Marinosulfonomonas sp.]|nr:hypothetical protein [Marinosulfonomonas sp.]
MISYEQHGQVGTIVMENPPVNAIDDAFVEQMHAALDKAKAAGPTILAIKSKQKCFCAGADLAMIAGLFDDPDGTPKMETYTRSLHTLFDRIEAFHGMYKAMSGEFFLADHLVGRRVSSRRLAGITHEEAVEV